MEDVLDVRLEQDEVRDRALWCMDDEDDIEEEEEDRVLVYDVDLPKGEETKVEVEGLLVSLPVVPAASDSCGPAYSCLCPCCSALGTSGAIPGRRTYRVLELSTQAEVAEGELVYTDGVLVTMRVSLSGLPTEAVPLAVMPMFAIFGMPGADCCILSGHVCAMLPARGCESLQSGAAATTAAIEDAVLLVLSLQLMRCDAVCVCRARASLQFIAMYLYAVVDLGMNV